jgi:hypothetical protein
MLPKYRRAVVIAAPAVLLAASIALIATSARAGTAAVNAPAAQPAATCTGQNGSCSLNQQLLMPLKINIWTDASPSQGQQATVSWALSCVGNGGSTNTAGSTSGTVPFRTKVRIPQSGGADCSLTASVSMSGGGQVNAGLYPTLGSQVMISLPTHETAPGAPLAYFKCLTDKFNSNRSGAQIVIGGCGDIYANTWLYDGTRFMHGGLCLTDPHNGGARTQLVLDRCNGSADQAWTYRPQNHSNYDEIVLHAHGGYLCIDDPKYSPANGHRLALFPCNGGVTQNWTISGR